MTEHYLATCFLIGVSAASGIGPIFLLTLNKSSLYGFWQGIATAIGAALGDTLYFLLATLGLLSIIEGMGNAILYMEALSSILLIGFGIHLMRTKPKFDAHATPVQQSLILGTIKSFLLTILNPFMLLFFIFISINVLPEDLTPNSYRMLLLGGLCVGGGSLAILSLVAAFGCLAGSKIKRSSLELFSRITGGVFTLIGGYLLFDAAIKLMR